MRIFGKKDKPVEWTPIKGTAGYSWGEKDEEDVRRLDQDSRDEIERLLLGHKVTKVDGEHLVLDNGTVIKAIGHEGGCACSAGDYLLSALNGVDNVITRVEFDYHPAGDFEDSWDYEKHESKPTAAQKCDPSQDEYTGHYRIFVYADNEKINLMQFDGSDGNGYYGTGYEILVREVS